MYISDEKVYFGENYGSGVFSDNMRYRLSPTKRKRCRSRSLDQSSLQLPGCYEDKSAVLLKVKVLNTTPPAPVRRSSINRFQTIIAQQKQVLCSTLNMVYNLRHSIYMS